MQEASDYYVYHSIFRSTGFIADMSWNLFDGQQSSDKNWSWLFTYYVQWYYWWYVGIPYNCRAQDPRILLLMSIVHLSEYSVGSYKGCYRNFHSLGYVTSTLFRAIEQIPWSIQVRCLYRFIKQVGDNWWKEPCWNRLRSAKFFHSLSNMGILIGGLWLYGILAFKPFGLEF